MSRYILFVVAAAALAALAVMWIVPTAAWLKRVYVRVFERYDKKMRKKK